MYKYLFSPVTINKLTVKNRIAYPSLGLLYSYDGKLNDRYVNYYKERAEGGAGIVTVGPVGVDWIGSGFLALSIADDSAVEPFSKLTQIMRDAGTSPFIQLFHAGRYSHPILINNEQPLGPSPVYSPYSKTTPREMTKEDIRTVQKAFADAARRAKDAGFAGIEIIGSAGYLICQFLSPLTNQREDEYGGSFENRTRFAREVIEMCREAVGPDQALTIRMAGNDFVPGSNTEEDAPAIAKVYEAAGVDAINVTGGWHETRVPQLPMELPRGGLAFLALKVKKAVTVPVFASNRITSPDDAEKLLADGYADLVNLGRVLIADPEWPNKAKEGKADEIRPCVACSQGCTDQIFVGQPVFCVGNPRAGFEAERKIEAAGAPKKVLVAGAGPAGLEAAVTAAQRGHDVSLYEKSWDIGGQLWLAGAPPHKNEIWEFIRYYSAMLDKTGVKVHLNTEVTVDLVKEQAPDHVIVAEGAKPLVPPISGVDGPEVLNAWEVLSENPLLGRRVAIIGGGSVGLETALFVAHKGVLTPEVVHFLMAYEAMEPERIRRLMFEGSCEVTVFEMLDKVGKDVGKSTKWVLFDNLRRFGIKTKTNAKVLSIENGTLTWEKDGERESEAFDTVILASGSVPKQDLSSALEAAGIPCTRVGDCTSIGRINDAIHGGFLAALAI
ncbi:MAG: FAD-dependent oxidoreductase [Deltaproteobacteria bacterium]|nr:FAD-dependent oxidoreductase [Deltaproteobacteria bacterium]